MSGQRPVELLRSLAVLGEPPAAEHRRLAEAMGLPDLPPASEHTEIFVFQLHPYASVHLGAEGMLGGEARDRVAGFWRALGMIPPADPDHASVLLGLYASLAEREGEAEGANSLLLARGREALLHEHLAPWLPFFLERVGQSRSAFYAAWADLLQRALEGELAAAPPPGTLPLHLREAPELPDPRVDGAGAFLSGLLAPVRSGVILTRTDLVGVARSRGLAVRIGERRWMLEQLVGEDPAGVLEAISAGAAERAERHGARASSVGPSAAFWAGRARATARLLGELARDGREALDAAVGQGAR